MTMYPDQQCPKCMTLWYSWEYHACPTCNDRDKVKVYYPPPTIEDYKGYIQDYKRWIRKKEKEIKELRKDIKRTEKKIEEMKNG